MVHSGPEIQGVKKSSAEKSTGFAVNTKEINIRFPRNPYRLEKPIAKPAATANSEGGRQRFKYKTFLKAKLSQTTENTFEAQAIEAGQDFYKILVDIWNIDPKAEVLPWSKSSAAPTLNNKSTALRSRDAFKIYIQKGLWTTKDRNPYIRFKLAHQLKAEDLFSTELTESLKAVQLGLYQENIQAEDIVEVGSFLGSHPSLYNAENWKTSHKLVPALQSTALDFRVKNMIVLKKSRQQINESVRAVHVYSAANDANHVRNTMLSLYSSKNKNVNPMGQLMRFIPNPNDPRMVVTDDMRMMALQARSKQKKFLNSTSTIENCYAHGLHYCIEQYGITLKEAIMAITSSRCPDRKLFVGVEESWDGSSILLVHQHEVSREANAVSSALPLFLSTQLGPRVWTWFEDDHREALQQCQWDKDRGLVDAVNRMDEIQDFDSDPEDDASVDPDFQIHLENLPEILFQPSLPGQNAYGDAGTINTERFRQPTTTTPMDSDPPTESVQPTTISDTSTLTSETDRIRLLNQLLSDPSMKELALTHLKINKPQNETSITDRASTMNS